MRTVKLVLGSVLLGLVLLAPLVRASDPETWPTVYQDDFEDPGSGWLTEETEYGSRAYMDGAYEIQVKDAWRIAWSRIPGDREYLDFVAEVAFRFVAGEGEAGFLFRYQDSDNFYCFTVSTRGEYRLLRQRYDWWETLIDWTPFTGLDPTGWNRLGVVAQGDRFSFFLNGELLAEFRDDVFRAGQLALCAGTFEEPGLVVRFDDLVVREDPRLRDLAERAKSVFDQAEKAYRDRNLEEAEAGFQQALVLYQRLGWKEKEADCHLWLANCWYSTSDFRQAIGQYQQALALYQELGDRWGEAGSLMGLGNCYRHLGDYRKAIDYHQQSLAIHREIGDREGEAASLNNLGNCYCDLGDYQQAIDYHQQSLAISREIGDRRGEAASLANVGVCYHDLGDFQRAIEYYRESLQVVQEMAAEEGYPTGAPETLWRLYNGLGHSYRALGDLQQAAQAWKQAVEAIEWMRGRLARVKFKTGFMSGKCFVYHRLIPTLVELGNPGEAVFYAERAKARTLVDMMETAMVQGPGFVPAELQTASQLLQQLEAAQVAGEGPTSLSRERSGLQRASERAQAELEAFLSQLEQSNPLLCDTLSVDPERISSYMDSVTGSLSQGEVVLEYFVAGDETLLWVITEDGIQTASTIAISRKELADEVRELREELNEPPMPGEEATRALQARALGKGLYDLLVAPVEDYLQTASHLVIVPSDVLFYLPFGALFRCPECETKRELWGGEYLIERYSLSYAPSLASLYWPFKHRGDGVYGSALVVGNPTGDLEYAGEEAQGIASLFPRAELLLEDAGTKATVLGLIGGGNYDVIHLATHGEFDRELPLASRVYFNQWEPLYAGEMLGLELQGCELVVLSACQTGLPPEVTEELVLGDELQGLSQALFVAGTPSAVLTLWNVNDESTKRLTEEMYQELMGGVPKGEALRRAQLSLLRNTRYRHPYYWAPFVLYGVWE